MGQEFRVEADTFRSRARGVRNAAPSSAHLSAGGRFCRGGVILDDFGALILKVVWMINYLYDTGRDYTPLGYWIRHQVVSTSS